MYLNDIDYINEIKVAINETIDINKNCNPNTNWELINGSIRNTSIIYASRAKKNKRKSENKKYINKYKT